MSYATVVARGRVVEGGWQEDPPNLAVAKQTALLAYRPDRGTLHILAEVAGPPEGEEVARQLVGIIKEEYFQVPGGVTNGLRQGIRAANRFLYERNRDLGEGMPCVAGVSCAVLREDRLYLGHGGPAFTCVVQGEEIYTFPPLPWAGELPLAQEVFHLPPLGAEEELLEVGLYYRQLEPGALVVLSSPTLPEWMSRQQFIEAMASRDATEALAELVRLAGGRDLSAMVISLQETEEEVQEAAERPKAGLRTAARRLEVEGLGSRIRDTLSALGQSLGTLARRMLPEEYGEERRPSARRRRERLSRRQEANLVGFLVLLALIGAGAFWGVSRWRAQSAYEAHFQEILEEAEEKVGLAQVSIDSDATREFLEEAQLFLEEARGMKPQSPDLDRLESEIGEGLDRLSHVVRLTLRQPLEFPEVGSAPVRVVVRDDEVYILDAGTDRLYRYRWSEAGRTLQTPGEGAIIIDSGERGELLDIVWLEPEGERERGALLILQANGLLEYDPLRGLSPLSVVEVGRWQEPQRAGGFSGNFYLLDVGARTIFKYLPTGRDYDSSPLAYITEGELGSAVDMAIDGDIYVLSQEGVVMKFVIGERETFALQDLEEGLANLTSIFTTPDTEFIYLVDRGRILQFDKKGRFVQEFRPSREQEGAFDKLKTIFVDEGRGRLFILSGKRLYLADLPTGSGESSD